MEKTAFLIGVMPVGPKCGQRAGLGALAKNGRGMVFLVAPRSMEKTKKPQTLDLFEGLD